jgi:hypothetical protein
MKAPVLKIEDLDAQYPYGGQSGWFSLVVSAGQFAYWDAMTSKWCYVKSPEITIEALFSGLGISYKEIADGSFMRWNAEREALEMTTTNTELTVNKNTGKIDLRNSFARKIINGGLSFAASNIYPLISPPEGHRYILYVKSNNGGLVMLPVEPQALFDGKPWILISGVAALNGGLWNKIEVFYSGNEYFVEITNNF